MKGLLASLLTILDKGIMKEFESIWKIYEAQLSAFVKTKVEANVADDILQEIALKLHAALEKNDNIRNYQTWLFQVTRNTVADHYRKTGRSNFMDLKESGLNSISKNPEPCVCDLAGYVIKKYLPEEYATPLYLSDIEQIPQKEVAKILNLTVTATKSRIQRARKKLKELVTECIEISFNDKGEISDFNLKPNCELPKDLKEEMKKINLSL